MLLGGPAKQVLQIGPHLSTFGSVHCAKHCSLARSQTVMVRFLTRTTTKQEELFGLVSVFRALIISKKKPRFCCAHRIMGMKKVLSVGGGIIGLFAVFWASLPAQVANGQAATERLIQTTFATSKIIDPSATN